MDKRKGVVIISLIIISLFLIFEFSITGNSIFDILFGKTNYHISKEVSKPIQDTEIYFNRRIVPPENRRLEGIPPLKDQLRDTTEDIHETHNPRDTIYQNILPLPNAPPKEIKSSNIQETSTLITGNYIKPFTGKPCSSKFTKTLSPIDFVKYLKFKDKKCLRSFFWDYNQDLVLTINNQNMIAVLDELMSLSKSYNGTNEEDLDKFIYFIRIAYYWKFYYPQTIKFNQAVLSKTDKVLASISKNSHLFDYSQSSNKILDDYIITIDTADLFYKYLPLSKKILEDFRADPKAVQNWYREDILYSVFYAMRRVNLKDPTINKIYTKSMNQDTINAIWNISMNKDYTPESTWIIDNAVYSFGPILKNIPKYNTAARIAVTDVIYNYSKLSEPYLWAIQTITIFNNCIYGYKNLKKLCMKNLRGDIVKRALPNDFYFEDKAIHFKTKLQRSEIERLYLAIKDVDQQFFRLTQTNVPVEGDKNKRLNIVIYGSPKDYDLYHPFLYGLGTNNGGIYIESWGTLFTYNRSPQQSYYTVEELLRHEYTHYLQGRYLVKGEWGTSPIYNNHRMVWFDEGSAQFFVGSSSEDGIKKWRKIISQSKYYKEYNYHIPTIKDILSSDYSFTPSYYYYVYGSLFFNFLYESKRALLFELIHTVRADNIKKFDNIVQSLSVNKSFNKEFQDYVSRQIKLKSNLTNNPHTPYLNNSMLNKSSIKEIEKLFKKSSITTNVKCYLSSNTSLPRYSCMGTYTGQVKPNWSEVEAWSYFNNFLNKLYKEKEKEKINNFNELNCRFGKIIFIHSQKGKYPLVDFYCEGPLGFGNHPIERSPSRVLKDSNGLFNDCRLTFTNVVLCNGSIVTSLYSSKQEAEKNLRELIDYNSRLLFSRNPQYYRDSSFHIIGGPRMINYKGNKIYAIQDISFTTNLTI